MKRSARRGLLFAAGVVGIVGATAVASQVAAQISSTSKSFEVACPAATSLTFGIIKPPYGWTYPVEEQGPSPVYHAGVTITGTAPKLRVNCAYVPPCSNSGLRRIGKEVNASKCWSVSNKAARCNLPTAPVR